MSVLIAALRAAHAAIAKRRTWETASWVATIVGALAAITGWQLKSCGGWTDLGGSVVTEDPVYVEAGDPDRPDWAVDTGKDSQGPWAAIAVDGEQARLRWIHGGAYQSTAAGKRVQVASFWMAETECTQALWSAVMGRNDSYFQGPHLPVEAVSWVDVQGFLARLNEQVKGLEARLPTELEWQYACQAGTDLRRYGPLDEVARYRDNGIKRTGPVKERRANPWGMYGMLGNVWEWCGGGGDPVVRGGSWQDPAAMIGADARRHLSPEGRWSSVGFRFVAGG